MTDLTSLRAEFEILQKHRDLIYLDSACTSLKPKSVIEAEMEYYREYGACAGRSSHTLGRKTSQKIEECRAKILEFIHGKDAELVWTNNTTKALNTVIFGLDYSKRRKVVTTVNEHHAILLPLMRLRDEGKIELTIVDTDEWGIVSMEAWQKAIDRNTALVVTHSADNTIGLKQDVKSIAKIAHDSGARICIDGAQGVPHHPTQFDEWDLDFLCFSGHKMLGPTGIGGLVMKKEHRKSLRQLVLGGGTVKTVTLQKVEEADDLTRFEAGIQNYAGVLGLSAACDYLNKIGMHKVEEHEHLLANTIRRQLEQASAIIYGPHNLDWHGATFAFNFKGGKAHDVALMLDKKNIAVRSGFFCAQPALQRLGAKDGAVRASAYIYTTQDEITCFGEVLQKIGALYG